MPVSASEGWEDEGLVLVHDDVYGKTIFYTTVLEVGVRNKRYSNWLRNYVKPLAEGLGIKIVNLPLRKRKKRVKRLGKKKSKKTGKKHKARRKRGKEPMGNKEGAEK